MDAPQSQSIACWRSSFDYIKNTLRLLYESLDLDLGIGNPDLVFAFRLLQFPGISLAINVGPEWEMIIAADLTKFTLQIPVTGGACLSL